WLRCYRVFLPPENRTRRPFELGRRPSMPSRTPVGNPASTIATDGEARDRHASQELTHCGPPRDDRPALGTYAVWCADMKPYVICHMCTTIDGRILADRW